MGNAERSTMNVLSSEDTETLARLVERERTREALAQTRSTGKRRTAHFDIDEGVLQALNDLCTVEGIEPGTLIERLLDQMRTPKSSAMETALHQLARTTLVV
jgi:hypothetical protein